MDTPAPTDHRRLKDERHLRLLAAGHYVLAALTVLLALTYVPQIWHGYQIRESHGPVQDPPPFVETLKAMPGGLGGAGLDPELLEDPHVVGTLILIVYGSGFVLLFVHGLVILYVGLCLARRRRRILTIVFAVLDLTYIPLGTVLGIFVLIVLLRPSVKALYESPSPPTPRPPQPK